jgi:RNA polymerase sigma-70 factor (ECF subfamily)
MNDGRLDIEDLVGHAAWLRRLAGALVRDDDAAADLVQETLVTAWRRPPTVDRDPRPWLAEVARNRAHDDRRSRWRREVREVSVAEAVGGATPTPEDLVGDLEIHRAVAHAVTALDEPFRQTVVLRYYEGLSAAEIALRLQIPAGTVRWRLKEGLDRRLLAAIVASSYDGFVEVVGDQMRAVLGPDDVEEMANDLGPHLAGGYRAIPVGTLQQGDGKLLVHLWKVELADGSEDVLVKMSIEDGQVTGFLTE